MAELVDLRCRQVVARRDVALGDDDDREVLATRVAALDQVAAALDLDRELGDQDRVGAAGDAGVHGDPARVPSHHLDDHDAVVALRRRVQPVDRLGDDRDGGVETEGVVGRREIVVDRLRHAHDRGALLGEEPRGDAEGVLSADRDEPVEPLQVVLDAIEPAIDLVRVRARGAQDRAATREDPRDRLRIERPERALDHAPPAVHDADHLVAPVERPSRDPADHRVQSGTVTAAREDSDRALRHPVGQGTRAAGASRRVAALR